MAPTETAYRATTDFVVFVDGQPRCVHAGDIVSSSDTLVTGKSPQRTLFEPMTAFIERTTVGDEQATRAPGEMRSTPVPKSPKAPESAGE